jgi:hypothetical protein
MSNDELQAQFNRCQQWQDSNQWFLLACAYLERGFTMNAIHCFNQSESCRLPVATETAYATR